MNVAAVAGFTTLWTATATELQFMMYYGQVCSISLYVCGVISARS